MSASVLDQIRQAETYKEEGNRHFGDGAFKKALSAYHKVFCFVNGLTAPPANCRTESSASASGWTIPEDRAEDVRKLRQSTKLNMAACYLKLGEHQKCVDACTAALEMGEVPKALFRRGQALIELRDFARARGDLERAHQLLPEDPQITQELRRARKCVSGSNEEEKALFSGILAGGQAADAEGGASSSSAPAPAPGEGGAEGGAAELGAASGAAPGGGAEVDAGAAASSAAPAVAAAPPPTGSGGGGEGRGGGSTGGEGSGGGRVVAPASAEAADEVRKLDFPARELTYAWQQGDEDIKVYVSFDQAPELEAGVDESRVEVEYGEWNMLLIIKSATEGRAPFALRLGDFHRRIEPSKCRCTVRGSRITLKLAKQNKEHWWNLLQHAPLHAD